MNGQFKDYIEFDPGDEPLAAPANTPVMESGTVIEKACFATDIHGRAWWIDPVAKTITRIE